MKPAILALTLCFASPALAAEVHEVRMYNRTDDGRTMVYEPQYLEIAPGDTVKFLATQPTHNAASIPSMLPKGAERFRGKINEEVEVKFDVDGFYGIQCSPHYSMGMVMLIKVGEAEAVELPKSGIPPKARERFEEIIAAIPE